MSELHPGASWRRSTKCDNSGGNCVEVANLDDGQVAVRNSTDPSRVLTFTTHEWKAFVEGAQADEFS